MKKLSVRFARRPGESLAVGALAEDRGRIYFEYAPEYLSAGFSLSPLRLPFEGGLFEHTALDFGPLPGLFDDSLPDGWGLLLTDRHFRSMNRDPADAGPLEYAYALMASAAGIDMPPTRLFETSEGRFFGVKRFDRGGNRRFHIHTFGNLIQSNFRVPSADYADLLKTASILTRNHQDVLRSLRQMAFNVAAHNRDDHVKNFSFLMNDANGDWTLSPAYDLMHAPGPGGEHSMTLAGEGKNPGRTHILRLAEQAGVARPQALAVLDEVRAAVNRWKGFAARAGVSKTRSREIEASFPKLSPRR